MDTIQLLCEISVLRQKMDKAEAFLEELVEYLLVTCKDDDYITPEVICRKLGKYGYIEFENGYWVNPLADRKTENSSEKPNNCEECKHWNDTEDDCADRHECRATTEDWKDKMWAEAVVTEPTTEDCSTVPTISKMEQVDKDINVRSKDEPPKCSVNGRPYSKCSSCEHFRCTADEPQADLIKRSDAVDAIENVDWYHQNSNKDMVSGANSDEHQAWYKADDIYEALEAVPSINRKE